MWHWADPDDARVPWDDLAGLPLSAADLAAKSAAVHHHVSQTEALSAAPGDEAVLPAPTVAHFLRPVEAYVVTPATASAAHFDELYRRADDPWGLATRFYEQRKREALLAALPAARFPRAFEPGCATGVLTARLADRCDEVVAWDVAAAAVDRTRARLRAAGLEGGVTVGAGRDPGPVAGRPVRPRGAVRGRLLRGVAPRAGPARDRCAHRRRRRGRAALAAPAPAHAHTGDAVHAALGAALTTVVAHVEEDFLLHVWGQGRGATSPARREGIVG